MSRPIESRRDERGAALAIALIVVLILSLLALALFQSLNVETKVSGYGLRESKALNFAEAGIAEAIERIRSREVPDNQNPRMVTQIFNASAGNVPVLGADSTALATAQPAGSWLAYSTATKGSDALTVTYKTDAARTQIYKYDETRSPAVQTASGMPIYVVTVSGRDGDVRRKVVAEVTMTRTAGSTHAKAAANGWAQINCSVLAHLCGYDHVLTTPTWTGCVTGRDGSATSCNKNLAADQWETDAPPIAAAWSGAGIGVKDDTIQYGEAPVAREFQSPNYTGPWEVLGQTQAQFVAGLPPRQSTIPANLNGIIYVDNDNIPHNSSGKWHLYGPISGTGMFYIDGDLDISGDFDYRGMIYAEGYCKTSDKLWVLGMVYSGQKLEINSKNYGCAVLYSSEAIMQGAGLFGSKTTTLSWREVP
ncbi:MAG TPA: PilX N-terminal domain-containing pilus assembly protein [Candidatus Eisenbacteria bacterium]